MTTANLSALTWQVYAGNTTDLIAPVLVDLSTYTGISVVPSGGGLGASANLSATGVVVDNMNGAGDCSVIIGPITTLVPRFQKANLPIPQSTTAVQFASASPIKPIAYFYTGTFHGEGGSVNAFASQEAANVASITGGTTDAYLNSLTWNVNVKLANGYNLDNLTTSGFYDVLNPVTPSVGTLSAGTWQVDCRVYSASTLNIYQLARNLLSTDTQVWERRCITGAWTPWRPIGQQVTGQCQFQYVDTTHCKLIPLGGGLLKIAGNIETVPYNSGSGVVATNTIGVSTLQPFTVYFAYAYMSSPGTMALEWSTTAFGFDTQGNPIKAGDPTRTCVGAAYTGASGLFQYTPQVRGVATFYNRQTVTAMVAQDGASTASTTPVNGSVCQVMSWGSDAVEGHTFGDCINSVNGASSYLGVGVAGQVDHFNGMNASSGLYYPMSAHGARVCPAGIVGVAPYVYVGAGTMTYSVLQTIGIALQ